MKQLIRKYGVSKNTLLVTAGIVWFVAGINILKIGVTTWRNETEVNTLNICLSLLVFILFFCFIFRKQFRRHTKRIGDKGQNKSCPFSFFDFRGWVVMLFMIGLGFTVRRFNLFPPDFISIFYTGLSSALMLTGLSFIRHSWLNKKNKTI